jgi:tetratricopeptide (TPR) repeat protein
LGVRAVVVGRVLQQGETLTISAELVDVEQNKQLWGQRYPGRLTDLFAIQEEIAREISAKLRLKLTDTERQQLTKRHTANLKAFQYYTQGRQAIQQRTRENTLAAINYYEKALGEDPNYALAYTGLADAYTILGARAYIPPREARRKIEEMAHKALALDENLAEAYTALGETWWYAPYNFAQSDRAFRRALELNPNLATTYGYLCYSLAGQGRFEESLQMIARARELDPLSSAIARTEALPNLLKRDYAKALELLRQATELGPPFTQTWEIGAYLPTGLFEQALKELEQAKRTRPNDPLLIGSTGIVYAAQGKREEALQIIRELEAMSGTSLSAANWVTKIYAAMNEQEKALSLLERSLAADEIGVFYKNEPVWDSIRHTPRFAELLRRMGIPQ